MSVAVPWLLEIYTYSSIKSQTESDKRKKYAQSKNMQNANQPSVQAKMKRFTRL